ncbi:MAG: TRAP transporter small permease subunit [Candidatus Lambdaproteobacteria bacterium]|nr:TRAP transporter small permease subunit [Candidatus Lambdaproteobacteria bacterium]
MQVLVKRLKSIALAIDSLNERIGRAIAWTALAMVLVQFVVVILRYVFAWGSIPAQESIWYFHGILFMIGAGYTLLKDGHVRVDIFYRESSPRTKAMVDLFGVIVFLLPVCLLIWGMSWSYVLNSWRVLEGSTETSGLPTIFLLKSVIPIFVILLSLEGISLAIKSFLVIVGVEKQMPVGQHLEEL